MKTLIMEGNPSYINEFKTYTSSFCCKFILLSIVFFCCCLNVELFKFLQGFFNGQFFIHQFIDKSNQFFSES